MADDTPSPLATAFPNADTTPTDQTYAARRVLYDPNAVNDPAVAGALSRGNGGGDNPYAQQLSATAADLQGDQPLSQQYGALQQRKDAAVAARQQKMQDAMNILNAAKAGQTTNLPMLAAAGAMLAPTRTGTFSESLGHAFTAAVPPTEQDRTRNWQQDTSLAGLGIKSGDEDVAAAQSDIGDFYKRLAEVQKMQMGAAVTGTRSQVAQTAADARIQSAQEVAQARREAAQIAAGAKVDIATMQKDRNSWVYLGNDPNDPSQGVYFNKTLGSVNYGPAVQSTKAGGADPARIREANELVKQGVAPDFATAYGMVRSGVNDATTWQKMQLNEEKYLKDLPNMNQKTPQEIENMAREAIVRKNGGKNPWDPQPAAPAQGGQQGDQGQPGGAGGAQPQPKTTAPAIPVGKTASDGKGNKVQWNGRAWVPLQQAQPEPQMQGQ